MLSIIITAYKEEKTIANAVRSLIDANYSGIGLGQIDKSWELIVCAPDKPTQDNALKEIERLKIDSSRYKILVDEKKGKPIALNMCLLAARGEWLLLTDGDVYAKEGAVKEIVETADLYIESHVEGKLGGVSGRPVGEKSKTNMMNYWGALLADAANHKRNIDLTDKPDGLSSRFIPKRKFFPLSGYLMLIRNEKITVPEDCLVDDAYLSYQLYNKGYDLTYSPKAEVVVKYPTKLKDYFIQKKRSTGGYLQLWKYGVVKVETKSRSFWRELEYIWFPLRYAKNLRELLWSLALYPVRLWLWIKIYWERKVTNKDFTSTWQRVESTK